MFPRNQRLTQKRLFDTLFKRGAWIRGKYFSLIYLPRPQQGKIGFIITKKIAKSAVIRNQMKRRLRAAFLHVSQQKEFNPLFQNNTIVIVIHRNTGELPFEKLTEEVVLRITQIKQQNRQPKTTPEK